MTKEEIFEVFLENYPWLEEDLVLIYYMPVYFKDFGIKIIFKDGCICEFYYVDNPIDTVAHFTPPKYLLGRKGDLYDTDKN